MGKDRKQIMEKGQKIPIVWKLILNIVKEN